MKIAHLKQDYCNLIVCITPLLRDGTSEFGGPLRPQKVACLLPPGDISLSGQKFFRSLEIHNLCDLLLLLFTGGCTIE